MGTNKYGEPELIRVTLIDYFTGEVLIDNLVKPDVAMQHLNTQYSGVTWGDMRKAQIHGTALQGKAGARFAVWWFVSTETVVVGHGVSNDLRALRWIHALVVDSYVVEFGFVKRKEAEIAAAAEKEAERLEAMGADGKVVGLGEKDSLLGDFLVKGTPSLDVVGNVVGGVGGNAPGDKGNGAASKTKKKKGGGNLALKNLAEKRLHRKIQTGGKKGHDSLEDAIAVSSPRVANLASKPFTDRTSSPRLGTWFTGFS
jgi:RNA exonuclease 1